MVSQTGPKAKTQRKPNPEGRQGMHLRRVHRFMKSSDQEAFGDQARLGPKLTPDRAPLALLSRTRAKPRREVRVARAGQEEGKSAGPGKAVKSWLRGERAEEQPLVTQRLSC